MPKEAPRRSRSLRRPQAHRPPTLKRRALAGINRPHNNVGHWTAAKRCGAAPLDPVVRSRFNPGRQSHRRGQARRKRAKKRSIYPSSPRRPISTDGTSTMVHLPPLWWGHRIPPGTVPIATNHRGAQTPPPAHCGSGPDHPGNRCARHLVLLRLLPSPSSAGPISTAENRADFDAFYPTSLLVTGFDILFFWVARMIMLAAGSPPMWPMPAQPALAGRFGPVPRGLHPRLVRDANRERCPRPRATSSTHRNRQEYGRMRSASRWPRWPRPDRHRLQRGRTRAIAPSPTRSGTPPASSS